MTKLSINISVETIVPTGHCCECDHKMNGCSGSCKPSPNDFTLCIQCGSLNIFTDNLELRAPNDDEMIEAASNSDIQHARRMIKKVNS